jgi:hypothetical protein
LYRIIWHSGSGIGGFLTVTGTVPRLEQLDFFAGFCLIQRSVPKPKLYRALTSREKDILKQVHALNDPLIIEAINLFNAEVHDVVLG